MKDRVICNYHKDCFARKDAFCGILENNTFKNDCPFYKNKDQNKMEREAVELELIERKRFDLLETYYPKYKKKGAQNE